MSTKKIEDFDQFAPRPVQGTRVIDKDDADRFAIAAKEYTAFHTRSQEAAFQNLLYLGFIDESGKLTENYR